MKAITLTRAQVQRARLSAHYDLHEELWGHQYDGPLVEGQGSTSPTIVFILDHPNAMDEKEGKAFAGRQMKFIRKMMRDAGLDPNKAFFTTFGKYKPPPSDGNPIMNEVPACMHMLRNELEILGAKWVVPMGGFSISLFLEVAPHMDTMVGKMFRKKGYNVFPMYSLPQQMHDDDTRYKSETHYKRLYGLLNPDRAKGDTPTRKRRLTPRRKA